MTKITKYFEEAAGKTLFSIEIIPPMKGQHLGELMSHIEPLMEFKPPFIEVTYHREEYVDKVVDGVSKRIPIRKRPGTLGICASIMQRFQIEAVPHVICGGFTKEETEDFLIDLHYLGIENALLLRGDQEKGEAHFIPKPGGHAYANELVEQVAAMNQGILLHEETESLPTNFCIGVAGYPEKHIDAVSFDQDLRYLKQKVDAGADYIVTQMFFDNAKYFDFVKKCREMGIIVPIIPGLKPLATERQLDILPEIFHLEIPTEFVSEARKCANNAAIKQLGIEWAVQQGKELIQAGVPALHFYTMSKSDSVRAIAEKLF
ncbi:methylenetetrahydrofolate reductase [NAD(P)H] [Aquirufa antheringensis]|jgi:methylenetetrahydrofolate reductase (NADPH)|uniref:Methylenetetrahydrofolate reductase n=1 Tax=Aquirufa antheringensis TaxID=2516559 RepID=A0A4V2IVH2_9BACT|nr:methylenetetrahydrofolate reductase [NAD(P)H] [Aquirufa antheringensis]MCZ2485742.1 methylenetetrahydrofolate reductase [NAD(P)H] [Aquirufa antheringensis]MCZ2486565.1 methylenetetrahydrofolate reductase [NAD(P)H] [Aquirufa antheringensis]MCZ2488654.1 methylenetetrahydrofolate reductase [NAD(P)H] [Aquirufa antheringensis]TBH71122.1 methylenetetrahydrofolate reductase [NAD(P)H] [Aquirufa antheringensis]